MSKQNKTQPTKINAADFLANIEDGEKQQDCILLDQWMQAISNETPVMWGASIVGYGTYHYKYASGREGDFMKVGFSPRKQAITLYIMTGFDGYDTLLSKLGKYKTGKSCLYIKRLSDVDCDVLQQIITASYTVMTEQYG